MSNNIVDLDYEFEEEEYYEFEEDEYYESDEFEDELDLNITSENTVIILIDSREPKRIYINYLKRLKMEYKYSDNPIRIRWKKVELIEKGDYLLNDEYYFERKTARDFIDSIWDGRYLDQKEGMIELTNDGYHIAVYIIGNVRDEVQNQSISTALNKYWLEGRIHCREFRSEYESFKNMIEVAFYGWRTEYEVPINIKRVNHPVNGIRMLCGITGIKIAKAKRLLLKFGSVANLSNATLEEITEVTSPKNRSTKTSQKIYNALHEEFIIRKGVE